jgi:hypothetical protein
MPFEARTPGSGYDLDKVPPGEREEVLRVFRDYFNLCSEELWLASSGRIDKGTWELWSTGIAQVAEFPSFALAWGVLREEYVVYAEFRRFMDSVSSRRVEIDDPSKKPQASLLERTGGLADFVRRRSAR